MLKGIYSALFFSIAIHLVLLWVISQAKVSIDKAIEHVKPIKSYLYQRPQIEETPLTPSEKPTKSVQIEKDNKHVTETAKERVADVSVTPKAKIPTSTPVNQEKSQSLPAIVNNPDKMLEKKKVLESPLSTKTFSAIEAINEKREQAMFDNVTRLGEGQAKGSIFNPKPALVPHSTVTINVDEKRKNATQTLGGGIEMIKGEDGTCYVERDLSSIGMSGVTSRESFACGLSEFDKAFNAHMKKLKLKLGK
ncbi:hypothetical protein Q4489_09345 [Thalassotalea sp. 1_MG-2023]|uniref:hypothetical protein n=1 Tax=Thalassotalea sp. 1_MG-2023 TaxID=3062680 RepID=UPI0026E1A9C8|nr:hypothetical protein [Thalassotalea sp. 1_MG-2023]MDO6427217.1 hypothetical protein [Thalassotalea sp. 1_MG-2023]